MSCRIISSSLHSERPHHNMKIAPATRSRLLLLSFVTALGTGIISVFSATGTVIKLPVAIAIFASGFAAGVALISYRQKKN